MRSLHFAVSYSTLVFFTTDVREIVTVYDEVIPLIRARSDVSHGLIMLVTHAALGAVDPATYTHRTP